MNYNTRFAVPRNIGGMIEDLFQRGFNAFDTEEDKAEVAVNIREDDKGYELQLVAPGLCKEDFKINLDRNVLTISFEAKEEGESGLGRWLRHEYRARSFKRSFTLNDKIDTTALNARYVDGILQLTLPKKEDIKSQPQEISVG
jgi:HSP20 family protein